MLTLAAICITILAYKLLGKEIKPLLEKLDGVDWRRKANDALGPIREYANRVGRVAVRPVLQFYYVLTGNQTTLTEKAMLYAAIIYTVMPASVLPQRVFKFLGILDEGAAVLYVFNKVREKITAEVDAQVDATIQKWFGHEYAVVISEEKNDDK